MVNLKGSATKPLRASVTTLGCRLNQAESQIIKEKLEVAGYAMVPFGEDADLGIINTCTVTREADAKCRKMIRQFVRRNPQAFTAVIGCYSQMGAKAISSIPGVDLIIGNQDKLSVVDYAHLGKNEKPVIVRDRIDRKDFSIQFVGDLPFDKRANLKIQDGCDFLCSFCIIPFARGRARARQWENTLDEARAAVAKGVRELVLTGVNIGTYLHDDHDIVDLVDALNDIPGLLRVRISSIEPTTVPWALIDRMSDPEHVLLPYLHLPLQSGCDKVLEGMRRRYTTGEYADFVRRAVEQIPDLCVGTDILVGFNGETEEDFEETCRFFQELPFAYTHVFPYSERDGTLSVKRANDVVPIEERNRRCLQLRRYSSQKRYDFMQRYLGKEMNVLLEDPRDGHFPGYTANYIRVLTDSPEGSDIRNQLVRVRLDQISADFVEGPIVSFVGA